MEMEMTITRLWFADNRIYVENDKGERLYQSLYFYPLLLNATDEQRDNYELWEEGIHWDEIDEDMSFESFYYPETKAPTPGIQSAFLFNPELNVSAVARRLGIKQSLLASYIKGTREPSDERKLEILRTIHEIGAALQQVTF